MIENGWIYELDRMDAEEAEADRMDHWEHDRDKELAIDFGYDEDIIYKAVALYIDADETRVDADHAETLFQHLPSHMQYALIVDYVEFAGMEHEYNNWYEDRYNGAF